MAGEITRIDALGRECPWPLILSKQALLNMLPGSVLRIEVDDPMAELDLRALCAREGHAWMSITLQAENGAWIIELAKRAEPS